MTANNTSWTPSASPAEAKGNTPATTTAPEKPFTGKPVGIQWEASKEAPKAAAEPVTEADAPENMTEAQKKVWVIKVNGKERQFDASDENELRRLVEKAYGADEAFQKSAQVSKQAEQFFRMLKEATGDPKKLAQLLKHEQFGGADFKDIATKYLWDQIQEEKLTPAQKEERKIKEELQRYKDQEAAETAKREASEQEQLVGQLETNFSQGIQAAHKEVGLHTNPQSIYRMAEYARDAIDRGEEPNFKTIAARVKQDYVEEFRHYFENADPEQLAAISTEAVLKKLRKMDQDRLKTTTPDVFKATTKPKNSGKPREQAEKKLDGADWRAKLIRERGG